MKKLLAFVLALTLVFGTFGFAAAAPPADVVGTEYEEAAVKLGALGVMIGDARGFRPNDSITRAEFSVLVVRALGLEPAAKFSNSPTKFADVTDGYSWAWGYINVAVEQGVIKGYSDTAFGPADAVTYEQAITMIIRALGYEPAIVGGYPAGYLAKAAELGVTDDVSVAAGVGAPRGAVAQMLANSLEVDLMMRETYGDKAEYKAQDGKNLLNTKIGAKIYEKKKVDDVNKEDKEIVIDGDTVKVTDDIALDGILDAKVTAWKLSGKIVYLETDSRVIYDSIKDDDDETRNDKIYLYNADRSYKTTLDAADVNAFAHGQYGRFVVDDSKIKDVEVYDMTYVKGGIVTDVSASKEEVKYFVGAGSVRTLRLADADDVVVIRDHKVAKLGDIKPDDTLFVSKNGDDYFMVAVSAKAEGELTKVSSSAVYVDGTKINESKVANVYFSTDDGEKYEKKADIDDYNDLLKENVVVYKDYQGRALYVKSDVEAATTSWIYAVVISDSADIDGAMLRVVDENGELVTYRLDEDCSIPGTVAKKNDDGTNLTNLDAVRFKLNKDGEIEELQDLFTASDVTASAAAITDIDKDDATINIGGGELYVTSATKILKIIGLKNSEIEVATWDNIKGAKSPYNADAAIYEDSAKALAKFIVITNGFDNLAEDTTYYGYVTAKSKVSTNWYELTVDLGGEEVVVEAHKDEAAKAATKKIISYRLNNAGQAVGVTDLTAGGVVEYVYDVDGEYVWFFGNLASQYTKADKNIPVYDRTEGDKYDYADLEDAVGNSAYKVTVFMAGGTTVKAAIIEDFDAKIFTWTTAANDVTFVNAANAAGALMDVDGAGSGPVGATGALTDDTHVVVISYEEETGTIVELTFDIVVDAGAVKSVTVR